MSLYDGIRAGGKHSYADFGLVIASREIGLPVKHSIRKTVPYMNGFYDFSKLGGEVTWGERVLKYSFDIIGATVEEMDSERSEVVNWLCNLHDVDIFDDSKPDYHFHGSYDSYSISEDGEQVTLSVSFVCYPFEIANTVTEYEFNTLETTVIVNNSGRPTKASVFSPQGATIVIGDKTYSFGVGGTRKLMLPSGNIPITVTQQDKMTYAQNSRTEKEVQFIVNSTDRYVTANGTAEGTAWLYLRLLSVNGLLEKGKYRLLGCPKGGSLSTYGLSASVIRDGVAIAYRDVGSGIVFEVDEKVTSVSFGIFIANGYTASNLVFYPRLYGITKISWTKEVL